MRWGPVSARLRNSQLSVGCDNHQAGLGVMQPMHSVNQYMQPGYEGFLHHSVPTMAEMLRAGGYHTYMAGKWHLGIPRHTWPVARGFDRSYAFLGGGASHFHDARPLSAGETLQTQYVEDDQAIDDLPEDFYSSRTYVDKMIEYTSSQDDDKPFLAYLAFTAPHDPLQVPDEWLDRYKGRYDDGYDAEIGRMIDSLRELGKLDDTVIFFLSDNGANPKEPHFYTPNTVEQIERDFDNSLDNYGRIGSFISVGGAWAEVSNTPLSYFKTTTYEGGIQTPLIVAGGPVEKRGIVTDQMLHVADIVPTMLELAGLERPTERNGEAVPELYGRSLAPMLTGASDGPVRGEDDALCFEMIECRSVLKGNWKSVLMVPPYGTGERWELYNLGDDPREKHDLAEQMPEKVAEMQAAWDEYAERVGYIEGNGVSAVGELGGVERFFEYRLPED